MSNTRIFLLSLAIAAALAGILVLAVSTLSQQIYNARTCNWANIDNIEMHARIDIPSIEDCDCEYDELFNSKRASFTLSKKVDILQYVNANRLTPIQGELPQNILAFADKQFNPGQTLFVREGARGDEERYEVLFDPSTRKLWVYLKYLN